MFTIKKYELDIQCSGAVKSLIWQGEMLVDWVSGGQTYTLDGTIINSAISWGYHKFDAAAISPSGRYIVVYETLGTKGIIVDITSGESTNLHNPTDESLFNPQVIREINRSYYQADAYCYPVVLFSMADGREIIAHCPDAYDKLAIENLESGERIYTLTDDETDYFFSRLSVNSTATRILSDGWSWHPCNMLMIRSIPSNADNELIHNNNAALFETPTEVCSAAFVEDDLLMVSSASDPEYSDSDSWLPPCSIALYDVKKYQCVVTASFDEPIGTIIPVNSRLAFSLYENPKLIDLEAGKIVYRWRDISSGLQESSILRNAPIVPPMAFDHMRKRLAVASQDFIHIIEVEY